MAKKNNVPTETAEIKAVPEAVPAAEEAVKTEETQKAEKKPTAKRGRKPAAAKTEETQKAEKKPAAKRGRKPAAAKTEETQETEKKPAAKRGRKSAAAKTEETQETEKKPAAKRGRKPAAAKTEETQKAEKKPAAKRGRKPAAAKTEETQKAEKKPAAKRGRKPAAEKAAAKITEKAASAAKKPAKKKGPSYEDIVDAAKKKFMAANITRIKYPIAVNVELTGSVTGDFYIYVDPDNQTIAVEPYRYDDMDVNFRADADELLAVMKGKKNIYDSLSNRIIKVSGITTKAILIIDAAF